MPHTTLVQEGVQVKEEIKDEKSKTLEQARVAIIGSGVVGQATGKGLLTKGRQVVFSDINAKRIAELHQQGFQAVHSEDLGGVEHDISFLTVSTPTVNGRVVLDHLQSAVTDLGRRLKEIDRYHLVVVRSTVPPGTTEGLVRETLEQHSGKIAGTDFGLCMNPEFLREKTATEDFLKPWVIVIGQFDEGSGDMLEAFYRQHFSCPVYRTSLREAEIQKYIHNLFNATKISFFNEMRMVCAELGLDAERIFPLVAQSAEASINPQYGIRDRGAFGGSCLPKDTSGFLDWTGQLGMKLPLLKATIEVNEMVKQNGQKKGSTDE